MIVDIKITYLEFILKEGMRLKGWLMIHCMVLQALNKFVFISVHRFITLKLTWFIVQLMKLGSFS